MMKRRFLLHDSPLAVPILLLVAVIGPAVEQLARNRSDERANNRSFICFPYERIFDLLIVLPLEYTDKVKISYLSPITRQEESETYLEVRKSKKIFKSFSRGISLFRLNCRFANISISANPLVVPRPASPVFIPK